MSDESTFRTLVFASIAITVPIGLYYRIKSHATGESLARREEGLFCLIGLRLCGVVCWVLFATYLINPTSMSWSSLAIPQWLRWTGAPVALVIVPSLLLWTFHSLGKNLTDTVVTRREHVLVTHGPYRWVRHPFYIVLALWVAALSFLTANWLLALLGVSAIVMLVIRSRTEEAKLLERFGDEYVAYVRRTGRFFPLIGQRTTR
jgi:protein-S-isoprenylcysteine O-methyltransferase Ste14